MSHIYKHGGQLSVELSHNDCVLPGPHGSPEVCAALRYFLLGHSGLCYELLVPKIQL